VTDGTHPAARRHQRVAAYAVLTRPGGDDLSGPTAELLLTRISALGHHPGAWTLPGGGVDHGEAPRGAVIRELMEETGLRVVPGRLLDVHDSHFTGRAPDGVIEDYHGIHLIFAAELATGPGSTSPSVLELDGTTDAVGWVSVAEIEAGEVEVLDVVRFAIDSCQRQRPAADRWSFR
jgi:8-oxo-dGTP pyrophosphatase MutT (NUDIX family)